MRTLLVLVMLIAVGWLMYWTGAENRQSQIEARALKIYPKDCYNWQDIEVILFSEIQE